MLCKVKRLMVG